MSLLVGISFGDTVVLASDSRHVWNHANGTNTVDDAVKKIVRTPRGLAAGIGVINVFGPVLNHVVQRGFSDPSEIADQLRAGARRVSRHPGGRSALATSRTAIMATFNDPGARLRLFHQDDEFEGQDVCGAVMPLLPSGATPGKHADQLRRLTDDLASGDPGCVQALRQYFRFFHETYADAVGPTFQFGVHANSDVYVSALLSLAS